MHPLLITGLLAGATALGKLFSQQNELEQDGAISGIRFVESSRIKLPQHIARAAVADCYGQLGFECVDDGTTFVRGDTSITRLPTNRRVVWSEIPMAAGAAYKPARNRTEVHLIFMAQPRLTFSPEVAELFREQARQECNRAFRYLRGVARDHERAERSERQRENVEQEQAAARIQRAESDDLAALGLQIGAAWDQIQNAYRDCCKKYHPDHLGGQNVAPHLIDLAVQRFKEISAAYQRIKERRR